MSGSSHRLTALPSCFLFAGELVGYELEYGCLRATDVREQLMTADGVLHEIA